MKKILTILILGIFLLSFASSLECWNEAETNTEIQLIQKCPSCSYVNLTSISYPNGTIFLNEEMTKQGINFNYTLPDSSQTGKLSYGVIGDKDGADPPEEQTLCIELSPTGRTLEKPEANFYFIILFLVLLLLGLFVTITIMTPFENKKELTRDGWAIVEVTKSKYMKLIALWISYGLFLLFVTMINGISNNYIFFEGARNIISNLQSFLSVLGWVINIAMLAVLFWLTWNDIVLNKTILKEGKKLLS